MCPLSNTALKVIGRMADSPVRRMLEAGLSVTVNSDDPAYFGGYMNANFNAVAAGLALSEDADEEGGCPQDCGDADISDCHCNRFCEERLYDPNNTEGAKEQEYPEQDLY